MLFQNHKLGQLKAAIIIISNMFIIPTFAHPHVLVNTTTRFEISSKDQILTLQNIHYKWVFDENFSLVLLGDYDDDKDGNLSEAELTNLASEIMGNLSEINYFTQLVTDGKPHLIKPADKVQADFINSRLSFEFSLQLGETVAMATNLEYALFDEEYYVAFERQDRQTFSINGNDTDRCQLNPIQLAKKDENIGNALKEAFSDNIDNQGMGAIFADKYRFICNENR